MTEGGADRGISLLLDDRGGQARVRGRAIR